MGKYVEQLKNNHHDIQLHTHPCWQEFKNKNWQKRDPLKLPQDNFNKMQSSEINELLCYCLSVFKQWDLPTPIAIRTGNVQINRELYKILSALNFKISSSLGLPLVQPIDAQLDIKNTITQFDNITEIPVTSFKSFDNRHKVLTITGVSHQETKELLNKCNKQGYRYIVLLTHIHEFIKRSDFRFTKVKSNKINLKRLDKLCAFVNNSDKFEFSTFTKIATNSIIGYEHQQLESIRTTLFSGITTLLENQYNDKIWGK